MVFLWFEKEGVLATCGLVGLGRRRVGGGGEKGGVGFPDNLDNIKAIAMKLGE